VGGVAGPQQGFKQCGEQINPFSLPGRQNGYLGRPALRIVNAAPEWRTAFLVLFLNFEFYISQTQENFITVYSRI